MKTCLAFDRFHRTHFSIDANRNWILCFRRFPLGQFGAGEWSVVAV